MNIKRYQILPHPAELRLQIYGKTIEELFINAAQALSEIQKKNLALLIRSHSKCYIEKMNIKSMDINTLLVDFLSEILAKSQINKQVYKVKSLKMKVSKKAANLEAELIGYIIKRFDEDIKAITYYGVDIKKNPSGIWQTDLVLDI